MGVARVMNNSAYLEHTKPLLNQQLRVFHIYDIHRYSSCLFGIENIRLYQPPVNRRSTRSNQAVEVKFQRRSLFRRSVYFSAKKYHNEVPENLSSVTEISTFQASVKATILHLDLVQK